jgi:hypothetical protein
VVDYLTRLVERTLQLSPTVRPDLPPTFAPETGGQPPTELADGPVSEGFSAQRTHTTDRGDASEERYRAPHSTTGDPSHKTGNAAESTMIEPRPAGDEPPREPQAPRRRSISSHPDSPSSDEAMEQHSREPEASEMVPDRRATPTASPTGIPEKIRDTGAGTEIRERSIGSANARPAERPGDHAPPSPGQPSGEPGRSEGDFRDETAFAATPRRREAGSPGARAHAATPHDDMAPDRRERSVRERSAGPDRPVSDTTRLEEHARPAESSSPEIDARGRSHEAPVRTQPDSSSRASRKPVSEAPVATIAGRQGGVPPPESATNNQTGVTERTLPRTVQVTIGRVEVRAISPVPEPAAQPLPESKPVPSLSLEDYLKQHNGARR